MKRTRFVYTVSVLRDDVPGWNHQPEDMESFLSRKLQDEIPHYKPVVAIMDIQDEEE